MEDSANWLEVVTAIGAIATPILVLILSGIGWRIRVGLDRQFQLEDKLRDDRIETYNDILEPFVILFTSDAAWKSDPKNKSREKNQIAQQKLLSQEYRRKAFKMSLVGSESVVTSYNDLMQYFFQRGEQQGVTPSENEIVEMISLVGKFLLEIRKSMGNEATKLDHWQMLEWFITDARRYRSEAKA
ncbi:hypothetical protein [Marinobacter piscensis]|uniref:hypothetical protein n=1 Tax=Marinobacter piscensis TaxID=1562308 RepID=UPI0011A7666C|nr:hypothetical protein [Marinobacter piscensis]